MAAPPSAAAALQRSALQVKVVGSEQRGGGGGGGSTGGDGGRVWQSSPGRGCAKSVVSQHPLELLNKAARPAGRCKWPLATKAAPWGRLGRLQRVIRLTGQYYMVRKAPVAAIKAQAQRTGEC